MTNIEFITSTRVSNLSEHDLIEFILDRVYEDSILVLEKDLNYQQQMELIARGLEQSDDEKYPGIKFQPFFVTTQVNGLIRNKKQEVQFNLIAPGYSHISETGEGQYSVKTPDGEIIVAQ